MREIKDRQLRCAPLKSKDGSEANVTLGAQKPEARETRPLRTCVAGISTETSDRRSVMTLLSRPAAAGVTAANQMVQPSSGTLLGKFR